MANDENVMQLPKKDADKKSSAEDQNPELNRPRRKDAR